MGNGGQQPLVREVEAGICARCFFGQRSMAAAADVCEAGQRFNGEVVDARERK